MITSRIQTQQATVEGGSSLGESHCRAAADLVRLQCNTEQLYNKRSFPNNSDNSEVFHQ